MQSNVIPLYSGEELTIVDPETDIENPCFFFMADFYKTRAAMGKRNCYHSSITHTRDVMDFLWDP